MIKKIDTRGIFYIQPLEGSQWYWGSDCCHGDLYEAEELFKQGHFVKCNRLIFIHYPEGYVFEPVCGKEGQYLGNPIFCQGKIYMLLADFEDGQIQVVQLDISNSETTTVVRFSISETEDCYNLLLCGSPVMATRQSPDDKFQIIWPDKCSFAIGETESFCYRDGDKLYFSRWDEEPEYEEEIVIRQYPDGRILQVIPGNIMKMPDGQKWLLG